MVQTVSPVYTTSMVSLIRWCYHGPDSVTPVYTTSMVSLIRWCYHGPDSVAPVYTTSMVSLIRRCYQGPDSVAPVCTISMVSLIIWCYHGPDNVAPVYTTSMVSLIKWCYHGPDSAPKNYIIIIICLLSALKIHRTTRKQGDSCEVYLHNQQNTYKNSLKKTTYFIKSMWLTKCSYIYQINQLIMFSNERYGSYQAFVSSRFSIITF